MSFLIFLNNSFFEQRLCLRRNLVFYKLITEENLISNVLKFYCQEKSIKIRYTAPYMDKKNRMTKRYKKTLGIMTDVLLIDSTFLTNFWAKTIDTLNYLQNRLLTKCFRCIFIPKEA